MFIKRFLFIEVEQLHTKMFETGSFAPLLPFFPSEDTLPMSFKGVFTSNEIQPISEIWTDNIFY